MTSAHRYTHKRLVRWADMPRVQLWSYDRLLSARRLPRATWIFTDFDRLGFWELELAARLFRLLRAAGLRVLNDPARVRHRYALLRKLHEDGINRFGVWRVDGSERPQATAFPVFLRNEAAHRGAIGDLIPNAEELERRINEALDAGYPRRDLLIVQYAAEPIGDGIYRKMSVYKIGDRTVPSLCVHEGVWAVKAGTIGLAKQALYEEERDIVRGNPYGERLLPAFAAAEIDYGRADFTFPHGELAVYEINTNPAIGGPVDHPSPFRREAYLLWRSKYVEAMRALDTPDGGRSIGVKGEIQEKQRRRDFPYVRSRWTV